MSATAPTAVAFFHLERTGGTSFRSSFEHLRDVVSLHYGVTHCWFLLHRDLFPRFASAYAARTDLGARCGDAARRPWNQLPRLFVEFHSWSASRFRHVIAAADALRSRYAAAGGTFLTMTVFREPLAQLVSLYSFMPIYEHRKRTSCTNSRAASVPCSNSSAGQQRRPLPFHAWAGQITRAPSAGWQLNRVMEALPSPPQLNSSDEFAAFARSCLATRGTNATLRSFLRASFDIIATTDRLEEGLRTALGCLGWAKDGARSALRRRVIHGPNRAGVNGSSASFLRRLDPPTMVWLRAFTACDQVMLGEVTAMSGAGPVGLLDAERTQCRRRPWSHAAGNPAPRTRRNRRASSSLGDRAEGREAKLGDPAPAALLAAAAAHRFNCRTRERWASSKKAWCCEHEKLGCR